MANAPTVRHELPVRELHRTGVRRDRLEGRLTQDGVEQNDPGLSPAGHLYR